MAAEDLYVDNVNVKTFAKNVDSLAAMLRAPGKRTTNTVVSGRHGALFSNKMYDQNQITWNIWLRGINDDGTVPSSPGGQRRKFLESVDIINDLFGQAHRDIRITYTRYDGTVRFAMGSVDQVIDWSTYGENPLGKVSIVITMYDPFWREVNYTTQTFFPRTVNTNNDVTTDFGFGIFPPPYDGLQTLNTTAPPMTNFASSTAPIYDSIITFFGPFSAASLSLGASPYFQSQVGLNTPLLANEAIVLYTSTWTARKYTGLTIVNAVPNLIYEPSFEARLAGNTLIEIVNMIPAGRRWVITGNSNVANTMIETPAIAGFESGGTYSKQFVRETCTSNGAFGLQTGFDLGAAQALRIKGALRMGGNSRTVNMVVTYFQSFGGAQIGSPVTVPVAVGTTGWTIADSGALTTPALTTYVRLDFSVQSAVTGDRLYVDEVHARNSSSSLAYMDGDTPTGLVQGDPEAVMQHSGWTGFPGMSVSKYVEVTGGLTGPSGGTAVPSSVIFHYGSAFLLQIPPDNRVELNNGFKDANNFGHWSGILPTQMSVTLGSPNGTTSGIRIQARKAFLNA